MQKERIEGSDRGAANIMEELRKKTGKERIKREDRLERTHTKLRAAMCVHN